MTQLSNKEKTTTVFGLDLGIASIGYAVARIAEEDAKILDCGVRITDISSDQENDFKKGKPVSLNAERTASRGLRRQYQRAKQRREHLISIFLNAGLITHETPLKEVGPNTTHQTLRLRAKAVTEAITLEEFVRVLLMLSKKRGFQSNRKSDKGDKKEGEYLAGISLRHQLLVENKWTIGQYLVHQIDSNPHVSLVNKPFSRYDMRMEFITLWETQKKYHPQLQDNDLYEAVKRELLYQRPLRSQKGLLSFCQFESKKVDVKLSDGTVKSKRIGSRVIPRSHPLFQLFKTWQVVNNLVLMADNEEIPITLDECYMLVDKLSTVRKLTKTHLLKLLLGKSKRKDVKYEINYDEIEGNVTGAALYEGFQKMLIKVGYCQEKKSLTPFEIQEAFEQLGWNTDVLYFDEKDTNRSMEQGDYYKLWHLLYSYEGDKSVSGIEGLKKKLVHLLHLQNRKDGMELAELLAKSVNFKSDYGSLSAKAIRKILPGLKQGLHYDKACSLAGYRHSAASLTREEIDSKELLTAIDILPRNSLHNPIVEKVLNQMIHVVNALIEKYGNPDRIVIELARELKLTAKQRQKAEKARFDNEKNNNRIRKILQDEFLIPNPSRTDITKYKLWEELKENSFNTLYSNRPVSAQDLFVPGKIEIEHIIPRSRLFDDSLANKTLEYRDVNLEKGNKTAFDYMLQKYGEDSAEVVAYKLRCEKSYTKLSPKKLKYLLMKGKDIPQDFVERDLRQTQYIAKEAASLLTAVTREVVHTTGSITAQLREDWGLVDVMQELNWKMYEAIGQVLYYENSKGQSRKRIEDWSKRDDHRHHAMDAITIAFTDRATIQYFNTLNAESLYQSTENLTEQQRKDFFASWNIHKHYAEKRVSGGKVLPPMKNIRAEAKEALQGIFVSIKNTGRVYTPNINRVKTTNGTIEQRCITPRGALHKDTFYGKVKHPYIDVVKVDKNMDDALIDTVVNREYRTALRNRLQEYGGDASKAFTGKNAIKVGKNPIYLTNGQMLPEKVEVRKWEEVYTKRVEISSFTKRDEIENVLDEGIKQLLLQRFDEDSVTKVKNNDGKTVNKKPFSDLDTNPIYQNKEKRITIKRVHIRASVTDATPIHEDLGKNKDFVQLRNNHHVAFYKHPSLDKKGNPVYNEKGEMQYTWEEVVVSFFEATKRAQCKQPIINKEYNKELGWQFMFILKRNDYIVFANDEQNFNPREVDIKDPKYRKLVAANLYRVQKLANKNYYFRLQTDTTVKEDLQLKDVTFKRYSSLESLQNSNFVKVRIDHIGNIVWVDPCY